MTDAEFDKIQAEVRAAREATAFGPADPTDAYEAHAQHAEYGGSAH